MTVTDDLAPLLAPGRIGPLALRNRILMCPMGDNLAEADGTVGARQRAYFEARARGGAALLLVGSVAVAYPSGAFAATQTAASHDDHLPGLRALADAVHRHGAGIAAQLVHDGPQSLHDIEQGRPVLVPSSPRSSRPDRLSSMVTVDEAARMTSPFTAATSRFEARVATDRDLAAVVAAFADAAARCVRAGFDAIELHAGHGYLLDAFRSPYTNRRADRWGGSLEGRARLLLDTIGAVRSAVGPGAALWCRLNASEHFRDPAETLAETLELAPQLEAAGLDALHVSAYADPGTAIGITEAHTPSAPGARVADARAVKARVAIPVITFGRLEPHAAARVIAEGSADFVAMGRALLADPDLPNKLAAGAVGDVRPCIYQYRCIGNIFVREPLACVVNPRTGHEHEHSHDDGSADVRGTAPPRLGRVLVVGGGPAGLEAALRLAARGHAVTLCERRTRLGGLLQLAAAADPALDRYLAWLLRQVERAEIDVRLDVQVDAAALDDVAYDDIVVATGGTITRPEVPGADAPHVATLAALVGPAGVDLVATAAGPVVVLGGGKAGCSLAALLRSRGQEVTVVDASGVFAPELGLPGRFRLAHDLEAAGVTLLTGEVVRVDPDAVTVRAGDGTDHACPAARVVVAGPIRADRGPADELAARGRRVHVVGDARAAGGIEGATRDADALTLASR